jgi:hypothetical protein
MSQGSPTASQPSRVFAGPFDEAALARYLELSAGHYGAASRSAHPGHSRWKLKDGPAGPAEHFVLLRGDEQVGRILLQRRDLRCTDRVFRGGYTVDFLVDGQRAKATDALKLVSAIPRAPGFDFVYQTYNERSAPLYNQIRRFFPNYSERFALLPFGLPLRARRPLARFVRLDLPGIDLLTVPWRLLLSALRAPSGIEASTDPPPAAALSDLCDRFARSVGLHSLRNEDILRWRFATGPFFKGRVTYLKANNALVGYYATTTTEFAGVRFLALMDAVVDPAAAEATIAAIRRLALAEALAANCDMLFAMFNPQAPLARRFIGFPFLPLPEQLMKHRTPIFVVDVDRALGDIAARSDAYFLLTDLDYF